MNEVLVVDAAVPVPRLGERTVRRPPPGFGHVLGAAAGAFAVVAVVAFVVEVAGSDPTAPGVGFDAALAIIALLVGFRAPGPLRSAAVTVLVLAVPLIWFFALFGGGGGRSELRAFYLLTIVTYLALFLLGWTRGRAVLLAGVLLVLASWIGFEVQGSGSSTVVPFQDQFSSGFSIPGTSSTGSGTSPNGQVTFGSGSVTVGNSQNPDDASIAALATGLVFLVTAALLDRRHYAGAATPFIAVGALEALSGAIALGANHGTLAAALLAVAAGAVVSLIGALGNGRRGSTWIGVLAIFGGLVAVLVDIAPDSAAGVGGIALGFAVALGVIAVLVAPWLGEPDDGGMRTGASPLVPAGPQVAAHPQTTTATSDDVGSTTAATPAVQLTEPSEAGDTADPAEPPPL